MYLFLLLSGMCLLGSGLNKCPHTQGSNPNYLPLKSTWSSLSSCWPHANFHPGSRQTTTFQEVSLCWYFQISAVGCEKNLHVSVTAHLGYVQLQGPTPKVSLQKFPSLQMENGNWGPWIPKKNSYLDTIVLGLPNEYYPLVFPGTVPSYMIPMSVHTYTPVQVTPDKAFPSEVRAYSAIPHLQWNFIFLCHYTTLHIT